MVGLCAAAPALADPPPVTILRGSSAPPEPVAPPPRTIVEYRYVAAPPAYPVYYAPLPPVVAVHRHK